MRPNQACWTLSLRPNGTRGMLSAICPRYTSGHSALIFLALLLKGGAASHCEAVRAAAPPSGGPCTEPEPVLKPPGEVLPVHSGGGSQNCLFVDPGPRLSIVSLQETARQNYVDLVSSLSASSCSQVTPAADKKQAESDSLVVTSEDGITTIRLNRPAKKNALTTQVACTAPGGPALLFSLCLSRSGATSLQHPSCFCDCSCSVCAAGLGMVATSYSRAGQSCLELASPGWVLRAYKAQQLR